MVRNQYLGHLTFCASSAGNWGDLLYSRDNRLGPQKYSRLGCLFYPLDLPTSVFMILMYTNLFICNIINCLILTIRVDSHAKDIYENIFAEAYGHVWSEESVKVLSVENFEIYNHDTLINTPPVIV